MAENVEYRDPTPNNFPDDYDRSKVDQRILKRSDSVFHKTQGVDVREGLGQAVGVNVDSLATGNTYRVVNRLMGFDRTLRIVSANQDQIKELDR